MPLVTPNSHLRNPMPFQSFMIFRLDWSIACCTMIPYVGLQVRNAMPRVLPQYRHEDEPKHGFFHRNRGIIALQLLIRHGKGKPQHVDTNDKRWPNEVVNVRYVTASSLNVDKNKHRNPSFLLDPRTSARSDNLKLQEQRAEQSM